MSSNQTSEEDLLNSHGKPLSKHQTPLSHSFLTESQTADLKPTLLALKATLRQKEEEIISLKSLNQNLRSDLKTQKSLDDQLKTEVIHLTQKRKDLEETLKQLREERGQEKVEMRKLATQKENLVSEVDELKESMQFLEDEVRELRRENEQLKERNSNVEKDKYVLQCNMDKLNRMLTRESAESKRYRSLIDLQRSAINDLQRDYNKVIVDLSNQENEHPEYASHRISESADISNSMVNMLSDQKMPKSSSLKQEMFQFSQFANLRKMRNNSEAHPQTLLFHDFASIKESSKKEHEQSKQFSEAWKDENGENFSKTFSVMERTFDHGSKLQGLDHSHHVTLTEGQSQRSGLGFIPKYNPKFKQHPLLGTLESKRGSTEQLIEVSPGNCSPEVITDKSDSFIENSTILNSPDAKWTSENKLIDNKESIKRMQCRRESRVLIQPLPRLQTQSKYNGFRQAKSTERREYSSARNRLISHCTATEVKFERVSKETLVIPKNKSSMYVISPQTASTKAAPSTQDPFSSEKPTHLKKESRDSKTTQNSLKIPLKPRSTKSTILYPSINAKTTTEFTPNSPSYPQLHTLTQQLATITQRKSQLQKEIEMIDKALLEKGKKRRVNTSRNRISGKSDMLRYQETVMKRKRKRELVKEVQTLSKSIKNVKARISSIIPL